MDQIDQIHSSRKSVSKGKKLELTPQLNLMSTFQRHSLHKIKASPLRKIFAGSPKMVHSEPLGTKDGESWAKNSGSSQILKIQQIPNQSSPRPTQAATSRFIGTKNEQMKKILTAS
jgi:hypothetical protein